MARVTIEDCLKYVDNRFALVHLVSSRISQVINGSRLLVDCDNKDIVTVLREIGRGLVIPQTESTGLEDEACLKIDIPDIK